MKAFVFAAGLGTRLKPITDTMPKALVPVDGAPLLYHAIEKVKSSGADQVIVNVHHFPDMIKDYLQQQDFGVPVIVSDETDCLRETGGAIKYARKALTTASSDGSFLVHNVDILSNLDMQWFVSQVQADSLATLVVSQRQTSRYLLFDDDMRMLGWTNVKTGEVKSPYRNLDLSKCRKYAFAGIHHISESIFQVFDEKKVSDRFSITDFYIDVCADYPIRAVVPEDFRMMDVGKLDVLSEADVFHRNLV